METSIFTLAGKEQVSNGVSHGAAITGTREGLGRGNHDKVRPIEVQPRAAEGHPGSPLCRNTLELLGASKDIPGTDPSRVAGTSIPQLRFTDTHACPGPELETHKALSPPFQPLFLLP